jgi:ABC-2 type transport system permease protein
MNLVRAELMKLRTTPTWWIFALISFPLWALALGFNWLSSYGVLNLGSSDYEGMSATEAEQVRAAADVVNIGANLYTTGQFFGVLIVMLLAAILMTNEFFHQTATTTFLTTPHRTAVIMAKLGAGVIVGLVLWVVTTGLNLVAGSLILRSLDVDTQLASPAVWRAIGLNALAYGIWAVLGVGAGVLIRSQIGTTVTLTMVYLLGTFGAGIVFALLADRTPDWFDNLQLLIPPLASQLMISGTELPGSPPRWAGAVVLIGYAVVTGIVGTLITRRRDIS